MQTPNLVLPRSLPDGSVSWEAEKPELGRRIREGDPVLGWLGDESLELVLNIEHARTDPNHLPRWEVWRKHPEGEPSMVAWIVRQRVDGDQLIRQLAQHDTRTVDVVGEYFKARDARAERTAKDFRAENEQNADKLAWALGKDTGAPAADGRIFATGK